MFGQKVVGDLFEGCKLDTVVGTDVLGESLQHQQHLRATADVGVDRYWEDRFVVFSVNPIELVTP